jgi:hypothetical protein
MSLDTCDVVTPPVRPNDSIPRFTLHAPYLSRQLFPVRPASPAAISVHLLGPCASTSVRSSSSSCDTGARVRRIVHWMHRTDIAFDTHLRQGRQ